MPRVCFLSRIKPDRLEEYRARHRAVWPEMVRALHDAGWRNYSLFLTAEGVLVGYYEIDDPDAGNQAMAAAEVNARWQAEMGKYFVDTDGQRPDESFSPLEEVFNLAEHLDRYGRDGESAPGTDTGEHP